jgi:glycosyltransferase involved in cell wall biosynthesis
MRIVLIVDCYFPTTKSAPMHMRDLGIELQRLGHDVTIFVPSELVPGNYQVTEEDGLRLLRIRTGKLKGAHRFVRGLREARLSQVLWSRGRDYLRAHPADLIVFYSPSIFFGPFIRNLKQLWGCPVYLVLRDIWPQFLLDIGAMKRGPIYSYFLKRAVEEFDAADVIGVQSPNDITFFNSEYRGHTYRLEVLHNWLAVDGDPAGSDWRGKLGLQHKIVYFYGGNFGLAQDLQNILRLAKSVESDSRLFFLLVGSGSEESALKTAIASLSLTNTRMLPPVGPREYEGMVSQFDVGLISLHPDFRVQNIPGKLLSY